MAAAYNTTTPTAAPTTTVVTAPTTTVQTTTTTAPTTTTPTTTTPATPCSGAGLLAIVRPGDPVPAPVGPSLATAERDGVEAASYAAPDGELTAAGARVGAAGCTDTAGTPGGTTAAAASWSVLGGAIAGGALEADLVPSATVGGAGWTLRTTVTGLKVDGAPAALAVGDALPVASWGVLTAQARTDAGPAAPLRWWVSALRLKLTAAHAGLPAGTILLIGYAAADRPAGAPPKPSPPPPATTTSVAKPVTTTAPARPAAAPARTPKAVHASATHPRQHAGTKKKAVEKKTLEKKAVKKRHARKKKAKHTVAAGRPLRATPPLGGPAYDFPVVGDVGWSDSYGGPRSDVSGGWHHGDDLFADLGRPVVAVADGTVFAVGWNRVGGWRLWLRDEQGNEFYYAHLSGYTKLARNNAQVKRGQVLGFVGNTGDAFTTPDHLHFEIHPVAFLYRGYDGAVDPSSYLARWHRPTHVERLLPVALPDRLRHGNGSLVDYRQLLALHGLVHRAKATKPAVRRTDPPKPAAPPRPVRRVAAPATPARASDGTSVLVPALGSAAVAVVALGGLFVLLRRRRSGPEGAP